MLRREVAALDPNVGIFESTTMNGHLAVMLFPYRAAAIFSALLGAFGLLLSSVGLFGVVAFGVARRTREFGIRLALGATSRGVVQMVMREQTRVIAIVVAGLAAVAFVSSDVPAVRATAVSPAVALRDE